MREEHVRQCQFAAWYEQFRDVTVESVVIPLAGRGVLPWLLQSDFTLSDEQFPVTHTRDLYDALDPDSAFSPADLETSAGETAGVPQDAMEEIDAVIEALGGEVLPKLNWSSPRDATWMNPTGSMRCTSASEVLVLLKSSDFVTNDLSMAYDGCEDVPEGERALDENDATLVLRKWTKVEPSMEFRCFVSHDILMALCQRECSQFFDFLSQEQDHVKAKIAAFFNRHIKGNFATHSFVFDVFVSEDTVKLVDFNPFGRVTDALLFSWEELFLWHLAMGSATRGEGSGDGEELGGGDILQQMPQMRIVQQQVLQPSLSSQYGVPLEEFDVTGEGGLEELIRLQKLQEASDADEEEAEVRVNR
mmetsp:Transcript_6568/g.27086  ORF Transcript_6568/g.27086 Transcript_6568/m.27086 type:complete len:361 (+) Transcript_6568:55-1137(+)